MIIKIEPDSGLNFHDKGFRTRIVLPYSKGKTRHSHRVFCIIVQKNDIWLPSDKSPRLSG